MLQVIPNFIAMTSQVLIVLALTFLINLISTLSYSVRIVGIRTGRIAISFALFNILLVVSRTANGFQAPLLAKTVENDLANGIYSNITAFHHCQGIGHFAGATAVFTGRAPHRRAGNPHLTTAKVYPLK